MRRDFADLFYFSNFIICFANLGPETGFLVFEVDKGVGPKQAENAQR